MSSDGFGVTDATLTIEVGSTMQVVARPNKPGGDTPQQPIGSPLTWGSSNTAIATVAAIPGPNSYSQAAAITGVAVGTCHVTATRTDNGLLANVDITVVAASGATTGAFHVQVLPPLVA